MDHGLMTSLQASRHAAGAVVMRANTALRLVAAGHPRWVVAGTGGRGLLWLTTDGDAQRDGADLWLASGQALLLPAGVSAVVESRGRASFQLVEAVEQRRPSAGAFLAAAAARRAGRLLRRLRSALQWGPRPACGAA